MKRVTRVLTILLGAVVLTALTPAYAASSFGRTTIGTIPSGGLRADFKRGSKFVMPEAGVLQQICAYVDTGGAPGYGQLLSYAVYRDQNGVPGQLLVATNGRVLQPSAQPRPDWVCQSIYGKWLQEAGTYWLMIHTSDGGVIRYYYDGAANWYGNADEWDDGASYTFGAGATGEGTISIRADYAPVRSAGATAVGTTVSSPMSANMKRGSSFTLTEKAAVWKLNAYIDAQGGAGGSQPLWIALYDDQNGEPGALVTKTQVDPGPAGGAGHWVSGYVAGGSYDPLLLMPGKYWIALYTGSPGGVLRYYMTGTGNWRGNANSDAEPSSFFGPANTGNGTITANVSYTAENVLRHTMGRTTPGTVASGPLSANYIRGSETPSDHGSDGYGFREAWLSGLWAYVDGNGGTAGSQKLRLVLYYGDDPDFYYANRVVTSDEVTIPAGKAAGWVRFPVPHAHLNDATIWGHFHVMLLSGGTQGVARYYLSNDANNWAGAAFPYSATGPSLVNFEDPTYFPPPLAVTSGTGTLSVYAEYLNTAETDLRPSP
jgi:hypothetical protein